MPKQNITPKLVNDCDDIAGDLFKNKKAYNSPTSEKDTPEKQLLGEQERKLLIENTQEKLRELKDLNFPEIYDPSKSVSQQWDQFLNRPTDASHAKTVLMTEMNAVECDKTTHLISAEIFDSLDTQTNYLKEGKNLTKINGEFRVVGSPVVREPAKPKEDRFGDIGLDEGAVRLSLFTGEKFDSQYLASFIEANFSTDFDSKTPLEQEGIIKDLNRLALSSMSAAESQDKLVLNQAAKDYLVRIVSGDVIPKDLRAGPEYSRGRTTRTLDQQLVEATETIVIKLLSPEDKKSFIEEVRAIMSANKR